MTRQSPTPRPDPRLTETRRRVLTAARELFLRRGYAGTTIDAIARRAEVSPQTIYNVIGNKAAVLKGVWDVMLAGDFEPVPMIARPEARAAWSAPSGRRSLELYAAMGRQIYERVAPLIPVLLSAAGGSPPVRALLESIDDERATGTRHMAAHCAEHHGLRAGLGAEEAAAILWTLNSMEVADRLIRRRGWSPARYEAWVAGAMADALFGPDTVLWQDDQ